MPNTMRSPIIRNLVTTLLALAVVPVPTLKAQQSPFQQSGQGSSAEVPDAAWIGGALFLSVMLDSEVRGWVQDGRSGFTDGVADLGNTFGSLRLIIPALGATWLGAQVLKNDGAAEVTGRALLSAGLSGAINISLKALVGRIRPEENLGPDGFRPFRIKDSSFPSGHTTLAFSLATSFARATPDHLSDALFYALATSTGFARMNNDRHWFSDVVAGAIIGTLSARLITPSKNGPSLSATPGGMGLRFEF